MDDANLTYDSIPADVFNLVDNTKLPEDSDLKDTNLNDMLTML